MMRFLKWGFIFLIAFALAWVIIFTFTQEPFGAKVAVRLPGWKTQEFPIYSFVAAAFIAGFLIGILISVYNYVIFKMDIRKKSKRIHELEEKLSQSESAAADKINPDNANKKDQHPETPQW